MERQVSFLPPVDYSLGGLPNGAVEIASTISGVGKSELALSLALLHQKSGKPAVYLDCSGNLYQNQVVARAHSLQVDPDGLLVVRPNTGDLLSVVEGLSGDGLDFAVLDDIASIVQEGTENTTASRRAVRELVTAFGTVLVVNQRRDKIARAGQYLDDFMSKVCSLRLLLSPSGVLRDGAAEIGHRIEIAAHYPSATDLDTSFYIFHTYRGGVDLAMNSIAYGVKAKLVELRGTYFFYRGHNLGRGIVAASRGISENLLGDLQEEQWTETRRLTP